MAQLRCRGFEDTRQEVSLVFSYADRAFTPQRITIQSEQGRTSRRNGGRGRRCERHQNGPQLVRHEAYGQ